MKTMKESLVDEIILNARNDRKRLEKVASGLYTGFSNIPSEEGVDEETCAAFAEEIAKISDSLTKVNQQLVELVKLETKRESPKPAGDQLSPEDKESILDEMQEMN